MRFLNSLLLVLVIFTVTACVKSTTIRHNGQYQSVLARQKNVVILPPVCEVNTVDIVGSKKRMYDYELHLESVIDGETKSYIRELGFDARIMHRKDLHEAGAYESYLRLSDSYKEAVKELYKQPLMEESRAFAITSNVGQSAIALGQKTKSDIIFIVDYAGAAKTNGARALDLALNLFVNSNAGSDANKSIMIIGIIDAKNGNVLWTNMHFFMQDIYSSAFENFSAQNDIDTKKMRKLIDVILTPLQHR